MHQSTRRDGTSQEAAEPGEQRSAPSCGTAIPRRPQDVIECIAKLAGPEGVESMRTMPTRLPDHVLEGPHRASPDFQKYGTIPEDEKLNVEQRCWIWSSCVGTGGTVSLSRTSLKASPSSTHVFWGQHVAAGPVQRRLPFPPLLPGCNSGGVPPEGRIRDCRRGHRLLPSACLEPVLRPLGSSRSRKRAGCQSRSIGSAARADIRGSCQILA